MQETAFERQQLIQEEEYAFPYHYIPDYEGGGFYQFFYWSWGYRYLSGIELILSKLSTLQFESMLDVGCGDGRLLKEVSKTFHNKDLVGIDYSEKAITLANIFKSGSNVKYKKLDIFNQSLDQTFDIVSLIEVLEHIPPDKVRSFLDALSKFLSSKPSSRLIVTVPHTNQSLNPKHYQHFTSTSLSDCLSDFFDIEEVFFFDKKSYSIFFFDKFVLKNSLFLITNKKILKWFYQMYKSHFLLTSENKCMRLGIICTKKL